METFREDVAFAEFERLLPDLRAQTELLNEADTRLRIIDQILFSVLEWHRSSVEAEKYCRAEGYSDYVLSVQGCAALVLEAKRAEKYFTLPERRFQDRPYVFGILSKESRSAADALQQAIGYAATLGARYVAVSNGHQWLFALTFVQEQTLHDRLVYVFESYDAILSRFHTFCQCFSEVGLRENSVSRALLDTLRQPAPAKLSSHIPGYPAPAARNIFQNELSYILDYVWQVLSQDEGTIDFVKHCYVTPNSHEDVIALVRNLLEKRRNEDELITSVDVRAASGLADEIPHLPSERPFVVLGEVGRGKSSFLKYLRYVAAKEVLSNYIQIELNFLDRPDRSSEIPQFIYGEIERQLNENYLIDINEDSFVRGVLHLDIMSLKKTPDGVLYSGSSEERYREYELSKIREWVADKHIYFGKVFKHLKKGRERSIALFLDNLDRRLAELQETAFLKASAMARDWASSVFICLRPDTYYRSQQSGVMDTIAPIAFTVGQPDLALVLKKRFAYAKAIAEGDTIKSSVARAVPGREISFDLPRVARIFQSCEFAAWKRHGIIPTLEAVSNGNIRQMLELARRILSSGHLDTRKISEKIEQTDKYYIRDFEGVKALLYGDYMHYDPERSPFINVFDIRHSEPSEHFIRFAVLSYLSKIPEDAGSSLGYIRTSEVVNYLSSLGYSYGVITDTINHLTRKSCVREDMTSAHEQGDGVRIKITPLGRYHRFNLIPVFQYLDAIILDTPILDDINENLNDDSNIRSRLSRTSRFLEYLDSKANAIRDTGLLEEWRSIEKVAVDNIKEIWRRIEAPRN